MRYDSTTGLPVDVIQEIVARVWDVAQGRGLDLTRHKIKLYRQVVICLILLRQNMSQMVIADMVGVSQPTICRIWRRNIEILETVLVFTSGGRTEAIQQGRILLVDGSFVPTGNRPASGQAAANYSGKRKVQCLDLQVAAKDWGDLVAVSDPFPGARHDARVIQESGSSDLLAQAGVTWVADTAHTATTALTPVKKKLNHPRTEWEKQFNKTIAGIRAKVEHCIAHLKNWKILATGYRGRLNELPAIIRIVTQLELLRTQ
ncbi:transposase [Arachnia propionica]|uniref:Transposase n=1 Tax=Arachnia propionica TaxID=1750 RepID=A0A3P1WWA0_9ACTN|nr:transposase [Arachnia propionica]